LRVSGLRYRPEASVGSAPTMKVPFPGFGGLGIRVWSLNSGIRDQGLDSGFGGYGLGFMVWNSKLRV